MVYFGLEHVSGLATWAKSEGLSAFETAGIAGAMSKELDWLRHYYKRANKPLRAKRCRLWVDVSTVINRHKRTLIRPAVITDIIGLRPVQGRFGRSATELLFDHVGGPSGDPGNGK